MLLLILIYIIIFIGSINPVNGTSGDILINNEDKRFDSGKSLTLYEGYELTVTTLDYERVSISLSKNGEVVWVKGGFIGYAYEYRNKTTSQLILRVRVSGTYLNIFQYSDSSALSKTLIIGESWDIGHGYTLTVQDIDLDAKTNPGKVWLVLSKDGRKLDDKVLNEGETYSWNNTIITKIYRIWAGTTSDFVELADTVMNLANTPPQIPVATPTPITTLTQTPKPISSNYKVVFDETRLYKRPDGGYESQTSETAWYGGSIFTGVLKENGFSVSKISSKPITHDKLQEYDVLIILGSVEDYSSSEIDEIERYVKNGGSLFLAAYHMQRNDTDVIDTVTNAIAKRFGASFAKNGNVNDATNNINEIKDSPVVSEIKPHEITKGVSSFWMNKGTYLVNTGDSNILAYSNKDSWFDDLTDRQEDGTLGNNEKDGDEITGPFPVLSETSYGKGEIVYISDSAIFINDYIEYLDNKQLGLNIVKWLAEHAQTKKPFITNPEPTLTLTPDRISSPTTSPTPEPVTPISEPRSYTRLLALLPMIFLVAQYIKKFNT